MGSMSYIKEIPTSQEGISNLDKIKNDEELLVKFVIFGCHYLCIHGDSRNIDCPVRKDRMCFQKESCETSILTWLDQPKEWKEKHVFNKNKNVFEKVKKFFKE